MQYAIKSEIRNDNSEIADNLCYFSNQLYLTVQGFLNEIMSQLL